MVVESGQRTIGLDSTRPNWSLHYVVYPWYILREGLSLVDYKTEVVRAYLSLGPLLYRKAIHDETRLTTIEEPLQVGMAPKYECTGTY